MADDIEGKILDLAGKFEGSGVAFRREVFIADEVDKFGDVDVDGTFKGQILFA